MLYRSSAKRALSSLPPCGAPQEGGREEAARASLHRQTTANPLSIARIFFYASRHEPSPSREPAVKFIHTSDLQIGKAFGAFAGDTASFLQDARHAVLRTLGELAVRHGATDILIAGDVYEKQQTSQQTLARSIESMRPFSKVTWHLMPGNHDHFRENGLWDRLARMPLPDNIRLHVRPGAVGLGDGGVLLPAPFHLRTSADDLTSYMDAEATPDGAIRIGLAHGSIQGFGSEGEAANPVSVARAERAGLAYLAIGDWHRQQKIGDRLWYSGTPEPDQFRLPPDAVGSRCNGGAALLVEIEGPRATPVVTPIPTGHYVWHRIEKVLTDDAQVATLETELRSLGADLSRVVLDLRVSGALSLGGRRQFEERILHGAGAALRALRFDETRLLLEPTDQDLDEIDHAGFVRVAADRLRTMAGDASDPARARLAALALKRLYLEQMRED